MKYEIRRCLKVDVLIFTSFGADSQDPSDSMSNMLYVPIFRFWFICPLRWLAHLVFFFCKYASRSSQYNYSFLPTLAHNNGLSNLNNKKMSIQKSTSPCRTCVRTMDKCDHGKWRCYNNSRYIVSPTNPAP